MKHAMRELLTFLTLLTAFWSTGCVKCEVAALTEHHTWGNWRNCGDETQGDGHNEVFDCLFLHFAQNSPAWGVYHDQDADGVPVPNSVMGGMAWNGIDHAWRYDWREDCSDQGVEGSCILGWEYDLDGELTDSGVESPHGGTHGIYTFESYDRGVICTDPA